MRQWAAILTIAFLAGAAAAQATTPVAQTYFEAEVKGQDVYVRSSYSRDAYHCTQLSSPARVTVVGSDESGKWYKILPPPGCYSVISKIYVSADADGKSGTVTSNDAGAKAGGFPSQPGNFSLLQKSMKASDRVRILGSVDEYYKIEPPAGAYFWIAAEFVSRVAGTATVDNTKPVAEIPADPTLLKYQTLHKEMLEEWKKPAIQRDYLALAEKFKTLKVSKESGLQPYVDGTIKYLQQQHQRLLDKAEADKAKAAAIAIDRKLQSDIARLATTPTTASRPVARGIVTLSVVYPGCPAIERKLVLRDENNLRIRAYLQVSPGGEQLLNCVGMLVGVHGPKRLDGSLGTEVIQVENVEILAKDVVMPVAPVPTMGPIEVSKPDPTTQPDAASIQPDA